MKLKKRIFLSNTLMLLLALLSLFAVGCGMVGLFGLRGAGMGIQLDDTVLAVEQIVEETRQVPDQWDGLAGRLEDHGYRLLVWQGEKGIYSGLEAGGHGGHMCRRAAEQMNDQTRVVVQDGMVLVGKTLAGEDGTYTLLAVYSPYRTILGRGRGHYEGFRLLFLLVGATSILLLLLVSQLFTRRLAGRITRPVEALMAGAKRIEQGDLSTPITYSGEVEFETVCRAFNEMQAHLLREQERTAAYEKGRTDMISGISHDLRTPLTSVKGYLKGIQDGVANTPEKREQYLSIAYQKACDMDGLLQRLFDLSRMETGDLPFLPKRGDLGQFVQGFAAHAAPELAHRDAELFCQVEPGPHPVQMDGEQFQRVLTNLVENAVHYAGVHPLRLVLTVRRVGKGEEQLIVSDNGQGVAEEQLPHLFEEFYRGDAARHRGENQGSGLGLYIVKRIITAHRGSITAENHQGLRFVITLPRDRAKGEGQ